MTGSGEGALVIHALLDDAIASALERARADIVCRCDEERDEPTDDWFDRSICPEPCGSSHTICSACGRIKGHCAVAEIGQQRRRTALTIAVGALRSHNIASTGSGLSCTGCHARTDTGQAEMPWPCASALTAATVIDPGLLAPLPLPAWVEAEAMLLFPDPRRANWQPVADDDRG